MSQVYKVLDGVLPCPFCGRKPLQGKGKKFSDGRTWWNPYIKCAGCKIGFEGTTVEEVRQQWNGRARPVNAKKSGAGSGSVPAPSSLSFDPADPEILWILGRPCFQCGPIAHILQKAGHEIKARAEDEQAAVILWMIRKYQEHGADWKAKGDDELNEMQRRSAR